MPLSKEEVLAQKRKHYAENSERIKARNLERYHLKQIQLHGENRPKVGRPRLVFPKTDVAPS